MTYFLGSQKGSYNVPINSLAEYYSFSSDLIHKEGEEKGEREEKEINRRENREGHRRKQKRKREVKKIPLCYKSIEIWQKVKNKTKTRNTQIYTNGKFLSIPVLMEQILCNQCQFFKIKFHII